MNSRKSEGLILKLIELMFYQLAIYFSYIISFQLDLFMGYDLRNVHAFNSTIWLVLIISSIVIVSSGILKTVNKSRAENSAILVLVASGVLVAYMAVAFFQRDFAMPRSVIILGYILQLFLFAIIKNIFIRIIRKKKRERKIVIVGLMNQKKDMIVKILASRFYKEKLECFIDPVKKDDYMDYVDSADKIYISDMIPNEIKDKIVTYCINKDKILYMVPKTFEITIFNSKLLQVSDMPMFRIDSLYLSYEKRIVKRIVDLVISLTALLIVSPVMLIVAMILFFTEGSPVLFKQTRVTRGNREFTLYKFRSMHKDAEKESGAIWAVENDPRITKLGRFLRKYWLDELPQLFNVIKGDMSLVGPRPERPVFIEEFSKEVPDFQYRLSVKAGITGLAQVLGKYATTPDLKIKFDLLYIRNCSLVFDIKIMFETLKKILIGTLKRGENKEFSYEEILDDYQIVEEEYDGVICFKKLC